MHSQILLARYPDAAGEPTNPHHQHIRWLGQAACSDPTKVGGKAANLSKLAGSYPVPVGFCVTAHAVDHQASLDYCDSILHAYAALEQRVGRTEVSVAVRSSAVDEDGASASFAG